MSKARLLLDQFQEDQSIPQQEKFPPTQDAMAVIDAIGTAIARPTNNNKEEGDLWVDSDKHGYSYLLKIVKKEKKQ